MKKFDVEITETLQRKVSVEAASQEDAERMVTQAWNNQDYAVCSWLRHLFGGTGELDRCVPADPDRDGTVRNCGWCGRHHGTDGTAVRVHRGCFDNLSSGGIRWIFSL